MCRPDRSIRLSCGCRFQPALVPSTSTGSLNRAGNGTRMCVAAARFASWETTRCGAHSPASSRLCSPAVLPRWPALHRSDLACPLTIASPQSLVRTDKTAVGELGFLQIASMRLSCCSVLLLSTAKAYQQAHCGDVGVQMLFRICTWQGFMDCQESESMCVTSSSVLQRAAGDE